MMSPQPLSELASQLRNPSSARRRAAAKALRKLKDPSIESALLEALENEVRDSRTWETQYQIIMALGECGGTTTLLALQRMVRESLYSTMVFIALGDALVKIASRGGNTDLIWTWLIEIDHSEITEGALRGTYMSNIHITDKVIESLVHNISQHNLDDSIMFWAAAAALRWRNKAANKLLEQLLDSPRDDVREAAQQSSAGNFIKYNVL